MFRPTLAIIRFVIGKIIIYKIRIRGYILYIAPLQHKNLSDEKPDDGQCWPKHAVLLFSNKTSIRYTLLCYSL